MLKIGLIGFGYWGRNFARVILNSSSAKLFVICDIDENQSNDIFFQIHDQIPFEKDYKKTLNYDLDAVIICSPTNTHFNISKFFLEKKIHVFCEKPLATEASEVSTLDDIARKNNVTLMVGQIFEFNPVVNKIKTIIENKELGEILYITMVRASLGPVRTDVNVVYDLITHDVSILNYLLDDQPKQINATGMCFFSEGIEDLVFVNMKYNNKLIVNIHASWLEASKERTIKIVGDKKMIIFNDVDTNSKLKIFETGESYQKFNGDFGSFQLSMKDGDIHIPNINYEEPLIIEFNHFISSIVNKTIPITNAQNALKVVSVLNKIQKSLEINAKKFSIYNNSGI
ncbi:MAG: Gfo/Idh/MocA family oxidoreductase [Chitinophagales bacterium]